MFRWRKATWALIIFDALMLWWVIAAANNTSNNCAGKSADMLAACQTGTAIGAGIGFFFLIVLWFIGFVVLSLIWLMSRTPKRLCPQCGRPVKQDRATCQSCGYNFVTRSVYTTG